MINQRDSNRRRNAVIDENEVRDENKKKETLQLKRRNMHRRNRFKNFHLGIISTMVHGSSLIR